MTGNMMPADEALSTGFVNKVVPADKLEEGTQRLAATISKITPWALRLNKRAVHDWFEAMGLRTAIRQSENLVPISHGSSSEAVPHGYQAVNEVTAEKGMRAGFEFMNEEFLEEDKIARDQTARPDRRA